MCPTGSGRTVMSNRKWMVCMHRLGQFAQTSGRVDKIRCFTFKRVNHLLRLISSLSSCTNHIFHFVLQSVRCLKPSFRLLFRSLGPTTFCVHGSTAASEVQQNLGDSLGRKLNGTPSATLTTLTKLTKLATSATYPLFFSRQQPSPSSPHKR